MISVTRHDLVRMVLFGTMTEQNAEDLKDALIASIPALHHKHLSRTAGPRRSLLLLRSAVEFWDACCGVGEADMENAISVVIGLTGHMQKIRDARIAALSVPETKPARIDFGAHLPRRPDNVVYMRQGSNDEPPSSAA